MPLHPNHGDRLQDELESPLLAGSCPQPAKAAAPKSRGAFYARSVGLAPRAILEPTV